MTGMTITTIGADELDGQVQALGALLRDCVHAGANINFVLPFEQEDGEAFWRIKVLPALYGGKRVLWTAISGERIAGSVQLDYDTPPNQPHRAEVAKLMVHPDFRRRGIARMLMGELENEVRRLGRALITLDTRTGDKAELLYSSMGYRTVGIIPDFCLDPIEDRLHPTTIMYKAL